MRAALCALMIVLVSSVAAQPRPELPIPVQIESKVQARHVQEAVEVFRKNAETWPESANVYDSLGEAQERAGARDDALVSYRRAAAIGKTTGDPNLAVFERNAERLTKK